LTIQTIRRLEIQTSEKERSTIGKGIYCRDYVVTPLLDEYIKHVKFIHPLSKEAMKGEKVFNHHIAVSPYKFKE
jgi:hypothetical protein